jgi:hypothetical protein
MVFIMSFSARMQIPQLYCLCEFLTTNSFSLMKPQFAWSSCETSGNWFIYQNVFFSWSFYSCRWQLKNYRYRFYSCKTHHPKHQLEIFNHHYSHEKWSSREGLVQRPSRAQHWKQSKGSAASWSQGRSCGQCRAHGSSNTSFFCSRCPRHWWVFRVGIILVQQEGRRGGRKIFGCLCTHSEVTKRVRDQTCNFTPKLHVVSTCIW